MTRALWLFLAVLFCVGCNGDSPPPGLQDVELTYSVAQKYSQPWMLRKDVERRLSSFGYVADVTASDDGGSVKIVANEKEGPAINALLKWRGGLDAYLIAASPIAPSSMDGLREVEVPLPGGGTEHSVAGAWADLGHAFHQWSQGDSRLVWERVDEKTELSHTIRSAPIAHSAASFDDLNYIDDRRGISIRLQPAFLKVIRDYPADASIAIVMHNVVLAVVDRRIEDRLSVSFGNDLFAYHQAKRVASQVTSGPTDPLSLTGGPTPRPDRMLTLSSLAMPIVVSLFLLIFVRRFDRAFPEPRWIVLLTFAMGFVVQIAVGYGELRVFRFDPHLDPYLIVKGRTLADFPLAWLMTTLVVGVTEEIAKALPVIVFAARRREFDEPVDGIVYASASAVGFAAAENYDYLFHHRLHLDVLVGRGFMAAPGHIFLSAIWGFTLGRRLTRKGKGQVLVALLLAASAHGLYDTLCEMSSLAGWFQVFLASVFIVLVRKSLRYGPIDRSLPLEAKGAPDRLFAMGNRVAFSVAWIAMLGLVSILLDVPDDLSVSRGVVDIRAAATVCLISVAAWAVTKTLPLEAVVRTTTVSFAGASRRLSRIRKILRIGRTLVLLSRDGDLTIGPGSDASLGALTAELKNRLKPRLRRAKPPSEVEPEAVADAPA